MNAAGGDDSGSEVIRQALAARSRKMNFANLARELGVPTTALEAFISGTARLTSELLRALARELWGGRVEYDPTIDRLRSAVQQEARPLGSHPPPIDPATLPTFHGGPPPPQPGLAGPEKPKPRRAGWAE